MVNMKTLKIFLLGCLAVLLSACASTKDEGAYAFRNMTAKQILTEGETSLDKNNYTDAIKRFEALDALYPFAPEAQQGELDAIYAYYQTDDHASALGAADRYIHLYPQGTHTDYAYYMKGLVNTERERTWLQKIYSKNPEQFDLSHMRQAFIDFNELIRQFPDSPYVKDAQLRMIYIRNMMSKREFSVAQFYYDHKAYVAAANRAGNVVNHYQGSNEVAPALKLMVLSYRALGEEKQANDALRVLTINFPQEKL
jgi:outer membrane protein assembly factor BamD